MIQLKLFQPEEKKITVPGMAMSAIDDPTFTFLVAFSGGKDSVGMVLYLLNLGVPKERIVLHHHDVDGHGNNLFDWPCTPSYCKSFADAFGLELIFSYREGGVDREMHRTNEGLQDVYYQQETEGEFHKLKSQVGYTTRRKFPAVSVSLRERWCSSVVKIDVMRRVINNNPHYKQGKFILCTGERRQESTARSKYLDFEVHRSTTLERKVWTWRAVIDFTERRIWSLYEQYKVQPHPCYCLGWNRCSCQLCIFSSPNVWAAIAQLAPWKIEEIAKREKAFNFTLYHGLSIFQKVAKGRSFISEENFERWAKEAMSVFVSPIITENWTLPAGAFGEEKSGAL